jgi:hypothetical protein
MEGTEIMPLTMKKVQRLLHFLLMFIEVTFN